MTTAQLAIEYLDAAERHALRMTFAQYLYHLESYGVPTEDRAKARRWLVDGNHIASLAGDGFMLSDKGMELLQQYREQQPDAYLIGCSRRSKGR